MQIHGVCGRALGVHKNPRKPRTRAGQPASVAFCSYTENDTIE